MKLLQRVVIAGVVLAGIAYFAYALATETGLVGWLNWGQQQLTGSYSLKVSAAVLTLVMTIGGAVLWGIASALGWLQPDPQADRVVFGTTAPGAPPQPMSAGMLFGVGLALAAVAWAIGLGWYAWSGWQQRSDQQASYEPMILRDGEAPQRPAGRHLALQGRLLGDHVLTHAKGSGSTKREDYHLVPIASPGWVAGQPAPYVVKVDRLEALRDYAEASRRGGGAPLLVRLDGTPPVPAVQQWEKSGVPLAPGAQLLAVVPSADGRPLVRDRPEHDWWIVLILCGGISAILAIVMPVAWWRGLRATPARA